MTILNQELIIDMIQSFHHQSLTLVVDDESNKKPYTNLFIGRQLVGSNINKET